MDNNQLLQAFIDAGWKRQEAKLYMLLLELGAQPASVLANQVSRNRVTTLHVLEKMVDRGYVSKQKATYGWKYVASDPEVILAALTTQQEEAYRKQNLQTELFAGLLPHLHSVKSSSFKKPNVEVFYGDSALKQIYTLSLQTIELYAYYAPWDPAKHSHLLKIDDWHTQKRIEAGIPVKIILPHTKQSEPFAKVKKPLKEAILVQESEFTTKDITFITDTHLLIYSLEDNMGVAIQSTNMAANQKQQFLLAWERAKYIGEYYGDHKKS
jgi:sugar-specific transcriptional regulator TrmB